MESDWPALMARQPTACNAALQIGISFSLIGQSSEAPMSSMPRALAEIHTADVGNLLWNHGCCNPLVDQKTPPKRHRAFWLLYLTWAALILWSLGNWNKTPE